MIANKYFSVLLAFASVAFGAAPYHRINQCKTEDCATDCPGYLDVDIPGDADGLGILDAPQCTVYYNSFPDWPHDESGKAIVYHDVSQPDEGCAYILLSPANVDDYACGVRVGEFRNPVCVRTLLSSTWMWQRCCGDACNLSSKRDNIRGANWLGEQSFPRNDLTGSLHAMKLYHNDEAVTPHSERAAVYRRTISRRDCSGYTEEKRYTTLGPTTIIGSEVTGPGSFAVSTSTSVSRTTSVSSSVGDPFGIVSASVGFETTEETSTELTYTLELEAGQTGQASWTAKLECTSGTFTGCGDAGDQKGEVCTPALDGEGRPIGFYNVIYSS